MMSNVVVVTFDNEHEATDLRRTLRSLEKNDLLDVEDAAVIVRDAEGKVKVDDETSHGVAVGIGAGALAGLFVAFMFPIVGIAVGAASGAAVAHFMELGVDKKFVKDVTEALQPGTSALLIVVNSSNQEAVRAALGPYKGTLYQTSLDTEAEETLREALSHRV
jgi:uncharacterized membrane protein